MKKISRVLGLVAVPKAAAFLGPHVERAGVLMEKPAPLSYHRLCKEHLALLH